MDSPKESRQDNEGLVSATKIIEDFEKPSVSTNFNTTEEESANEEQPHHHTDDRYYFLNFGRYPWLMLIS